MLPSGVPKRSSKSDDADGDESAIENGLIAWEAAALNRPNVGVGFAMSGTATPVEGKKSRVALSVLPVARRSIKLSGEAMADGVAIGIVLKLEVMPKLQVVPPLLPS